MNRLLIISGDPHTENATGHIRLDSFAGLLPAFGWETTLLCPQTPRWEKDRKPMPHRGGIYRAFAPCQTPKAAGKATIAAQLMGLEDRQMAWIPSAIKAGSKIIEWKKPDIVMVSGPPFSTGLVGLRLKRKHGLPFIMDYRDTWIDNIGRGRETTLHQKWYYDREAKIDAEADAVIHATEIWRQNYLKRYPDYPPEKVHEIPNGYEPEDYFDIKPAEPPYFMVGYIGTLTPAYDLKFLSAYKTVCDLLKPFKENSRFVMAGRVYPPHDSAIEHLSREAPILHIGLLPRQEAIELTAACHLLVYHGVPEMGKTEMSSRIYEYAAIGQRILAAVHSESEIANIIKQTNSGEIIPLETTDPIAGYMSRYTAHWEAWQSGSYEPCKKNDDALNDYTRAMAAQKLALLLNEVR